MAEWIMLQQVFESKNAKFFFQQVPLERPNAFQVFNGAL